MATSSCGAAAAAAAAAAELLLRIMTTFNALNQRPFLQASTPVKRLLKQSPKTRYNRLIMAQQYPPYDLVNQALQSQTLSLGSKLPKFEENEVDDACIIKAPLETLPAILGVCIPAGKVPVFIEAFKAAQERRKQVRGAKAAAARAACGSWNSTPAGRATRARRGGAARCR